VSNVVHVHRRQVEEKALGELVIEKT
jgi:hypothetical protein